MDNMNPTALAKVMANNPAMGNLLYAEMEKQRKKETLKRLEGIIDLEHPNYAGIRALMVSGVLPVEQGMQLSLQLKNYQNNVTAMSYNMTKSLFAMQSEMFRNELAKIETMTKVRAQKAIEENNQANLVAHLLDGMRDSILKVYYKPYEENVLNQMKNLATQISTDMQWKNMESKNSFLNMIKQAKDAKEISQTLGKIITEGGNEVAKRYYPQLTALTNLSNVINLAKLYSIQEGDMLVKNKGINALYETHKVAAHGFTKAMSDMFGIGYKAFLHMKPDDMESKGVQRGVNEWTEHYVPIVFGKGLGTMFHVTSQAEQKIYGTDVNPVVPVDVDDLWKKMSKAASEVIKTAEETYQKWLTDNNEKINNPQYPFDQFVKKEGQKAAGLSPLENLKKVEGNLKELYNKNVSSLKNVVNEIKQNFGSDEAFTKTVQNSALAAILGKEPPSPNIEFGGESALDSYLKNRRINPKNKRRK